MIWQMADKPEPRPANKTMFGRRPPWLTGTVIAVVFGAYVVALVFAARRWELPSIGWREAFYLLDIEEYIGCKLTCVNPEEELLKPLPSTKKSSTPHIKPMANNQSRNRSRKRSRRPLIPKQGQVTSQC